MLYYAHAESNMSRSSVGRESWILHGVPFFLLCTCSKTEHFEMTLKLNARANQTDFHYI